MSGALTIVMYHYVRHVADSPLPGLKALSVDGFIGQLDYLQRHYTPVDVDAVRDAVTGEAALPDNATLLTFDDGYAEHYETVFPILQARGLRGLFFPPAAPVRDGVVLDVNKIHAVLAVVDAPRRLVDDILAAVGPEDGPVLWARYAKPSRFDTAEVVFIKRVLQTVLPEAERARIVDDLFRRYVTDDAAGFAARHYMSAAALREMVAAGMYVGAHGDRHRWMDSLDAAEQAREVDASLAFLADLGAPTRQWVMCYPYGAYNDTLLDLLRARDCAFGLTTRVDVARLDACDPLLLPRLDTNDLPQRADAAPVMAR